MIKYQEKDIREHATKLCQSLSWGRGKQEIAYEKLVYALENGCPYCKTVLALGDVVFDHKDPIGSYRRAGGEIKKYLDRPDNMHGICIPCNQLKGDFTHEEYTLLCNFLNDHTDLRIKLDNRLKQSKSFWVVQRQKNQAYIKGRYGR